MLKSNTLLRVFTRSKSRRSDHWSVLEKKKYPKNRALENFDDFYGSVYGIRWKSMRVAMLCERKYMALVNIFGDHEKTMEMLESEGAINVRKIYNASVAHGYATEGQESVQGLDEKLRKITLTQEESEIQAHYKSPVDSTQPEIEHVDPKKSLDRALAEDSNLQLDRLITGDNASALYEFVPATKLKGMEDFMPESDHYKYYSDQVDFPLEFTKDDAIEFPETLNLYTYEKGNVSTFKPPRRGVTGVFSHYLMDGSSLLPPLVLDIKPGDHVLDACAAPGGKSLIMLQTLYPELLVCNDLQEGRINRLRYVLKDFLYDFEEKWNGKRVVINQQNVLRMSGEKLYDKILVDVPCTTDRHVLQADENNLFKPTRIKERLKLPETQSSILIKCMELLKPGGTLVYSTCSLSPVQNDGVVHMALSTAFKEFGIAMNIHDTSSIVNHFQNVFKFEHPKGLKYGQMVTPFLPANFGPMYFCKLSKKQQN